MGNVVTALSPRRQKSAKENFPEKKLAKKRESKKGSKSKKKHLISEANKLKFHVSHLLTTKIKKKFEDGTIPQTGVHAHHHMEATHVGNDTSLIHKNRRAVRAEFVSFVLCCFTVAISLTRLLLSWS